MQTALEDTDWRPGFAKRAPNFMENLRLAANWRWSEGVSIGKLLGLVATGTPDLTMGERSVLAALVTHLSQDRLKNNDAYVWPGSALIARYLGCSETTVRGYRASLERKGYLLRYYSKANRPAYREATDLATLAARLGEMADQVVRARAEHAAAREDYLSPVIRLEDYRTQAPEDRRLEQSQSIQNRDSVQESDAPTARSQVKERRPSAADSTETPSVPLTKRRVRGKSSAECSPERASGLSPSPSGQSPASGMVRQELAAAAEVCPDIAALLPAHVLADPASATPADAARWAAAAARLLPEASRHNDKTFEWAFKRHGVRALSMLAISLADRRVEDPCRYFGWLAVRDPRNAPDLRLNFLRLLKAKRLAAPISASPAPLNNVQGAADPVWRTTLECLRRRIGDGAFGSWFSGVAYIGVLDGVLSIAASTGTASDKIRSTFRSDLLAAAAEAGLPARTVVVGVRRPDAL